MAIFLSSVQERKMYRRVLISVKTHRKFQSSASIHHTQKPFFDPATSLFPYLQSVAAIHSPFLTSSNQNKDLHENDESVAKEGHKSLKLFVVQPRLRSESALQAKLSEALNLANSLEDQRDENFCKELPNYVVVQNPILRRSTTDTFFGKGTVEDIKIRLNDLETKGEIDTVFVNATLSAIQQRNLERVWGKPVLDRVGLIIEIFNAHAQTKEGKLQSELAALNYKKTRLIRTRGPGGSLAFGEGGEAEVVSARGRSGGGQGFMGGAGETELQLQRRRIDERRNRLLSLIEDVRRTRALQRASRKRHGGSRGQELPTVAIVGYTNAGKSTLVSALSKTDLYSDDRLFATVDPRLRAVVLPSGRKALLSDTVGFISDLPVQLIDAFHATLEEVVYADLLVHVLDSTASNIDEHRSTVLEVLQQIGVPEVKIRNMIEVWNKIDVKDEIPLIPINGNADEDGDEVNKLIDGIVPYAELEGEDKVIAASELLEGVLDDLDDQSLEEEINSYDDDSMPEPVIDAEEPVDGHMNHYPDDLIAAELLANKDDTMDELFGRSQDNQDSQDSCMTNFRSQVGSGHLHCHTDDIPVVKTSAIKRVGFQDLLELMDEKLKATSNVVEKTTIRRTRQRPTYHEEDASTAVTQ